MTWKEFKTQVEAQGVEDDTLIHWIDWASDLKQTMAVVEWDFISGEITIKSEG